MEAPPSTLHEQLGNLSYSALYDRLFQQRSELDTKKVGIRMFVDLVREASFVAAPMRVYACILHIGHIDAHYRLFG